MCELSIEDLILVSGVNSVLAGAVVGAVAGAAAFGSYGAITGDGSAPGLAGAAASGELGIMYSWRS